MIENLLIGILSFILGLIVMSWLILKKWGSGIIEIDTNNPDKDKFLFIFTVPIESISKRKWILFKTTFVKKTHSIMEE